MLVIGDRDIVRPEHAIARFRLLRDSQLAILPGTDHESLMTRAEWLVPMIIAFLDVSTPTSGSIVTGCMRLPSREIRMTEGTFMLHHKTGVIYGAGGAIGGVVARAFARHGASVFLAGRTLAKVDAVAKDISAAGLLAEAAQVDALNEEAETSC
jgi:hypothetical protein